jgi:hypothetical protein
MFYEQVEKINNDIDQKRKAIITLGCSFVQGMGAYENEIWKKFDWKKQSNGPLFKIQVSEKEQEQLLEKYPEIYMNFNDLNFTHMEYRNAFCNKLAKKYLNDEYASINLGIKGCGNRAAIKELHMHPELHWHNLDEIIVIYCPSGIERFDFVNDAYESHVHWIAMWPNPQDASGSKKSLWQGYKDSIYSDKFAVIEQISHVQELKLWCKYHNAKLIITPAFDRGYTKEFFEQALFTDYHRNSTGEIFKKIEYNDLKTKNPKHHQELQNLIDMWPWDNMFYPENYPTFVDLCLAQEFPTSWNRNHFWSFHGKGTPNNWVTPCAHPSEEGHDKFAECLYKHIKDG